MGKVLKQNLTKKLQKIFWVYICRSFIIRDINDFKIVNPKIQCEFISINLNNYYRVGDFREEERIPEYREKLAKEEKGYFTEHNGRMIGSIWTTINNTEVSKVVRSYMKLMPHDGLIHDIVTSEKYRGMRIGPFMVSRIASVLLKEYGLSRVIIDVNVRNRSSLRMMDKEGLKVDHLMFNVSAFGRLVLHLKLRKYA